MKVRYRQFEELLFNIKTYHPKTFREEYIPRIKELAGTEVDVALCNNEVGRLRNECDLPIFDVVSSNGNLCVCAHLCEID